MRIFDMKMVRGDTCYVGVKINGLPDGQEPEDIIFTVRKGLRSGEDLEARINNLKEPG